MNARGSKAKNEARHLTIRNVPPRVARALEAERRRRGTSVNQTVIDLLGHSLGVGEESPQRSNGLRALAGAWSSEDLDEFDRATAFAEQVDDELWR